MRKNDKDKLKADWLLRKGQRVKVADLLPAKLKRDCVKKEGRV